VAITFPNWDGSKRVTIEQIVARQTFTLLHSTMQQRVRELIEASGGLVGLLQGHRSTEAQEQMFRERYVPDPNGKVVWNGQRWKHVSGATAAPPGRSMHELGLAADMSGDLTWIVKNCSAFGLKHFADVNDEPWHVQPVELPNGRRDYEQAGSPWATTHDTAIVTPTPTPAPTPAPAPPPATTPPEVVPEARGDVVLQLQETLIRLGLIRDTPANRDRHYGEATQEVIRKFQEDHGLHPDAKVGPKTWAALLALVG
jgi:hypothetical protein